MSIINPMSEPILFGYAECALWTATEDDAEGTPLDERFDISQFSEEAVVRMRAIVQQFGIALRSASIDLFDLADELHPTEGDQHIGHSLSLTHNGHGTGFRDRDLGKLGDTLTDICRGITEVRVYESDAGELELC